MDVLEFRLERSLELNHQWCHPQHKAKLISISMESRSQFILSGKSLPQTKLWVLQSSCYAEHKEHT